MVKFRMFIKSIPVYSYISHQQFTGKEYLLLHICDISVYIQMQELMLLKSRLSLKGPEETPSSTLHWKQYLQMPNEIKFVARKIISERCCMMGAGRMGGNNTQGRLVEMEITHFSKQARLKHQRTLDRKVKKGQFSGRKHTSTILSNSQKDTTLILFLICKMVSYNLT